MAEIVGTVASAVTLASIFKLCVEAFDAIHTAQNQKLDLHKLSVKLRIEKARLYTWGQAMGLTSMEEPTKQGYLDLCPFPELVKAALNLILDLFSDSQTLRDKYGCMNVESADPALLWDSTQQSNILQQLNNTFDNFKIKSKAGAGQGPLMKKTYWVIRDRKKFKNLIREVKSLIDGLQDITKDLKSQADQEKIMSTRIRNINHVRTLDWVSEICEVDYPLLSDVASWKAETISEFSDFHCKIRNWKDAVNPEDGEDASDALSVQTAIASLEDLTVTELKHKFSTYLVRARETRLKANASLVENVSQNIQETSDKKQWDVIPHNDSISDPPKRDVELKANEIILDEMVKAAKDQDFMDEVIAMGQWFEVLTPAERCASFYKLGNHLSQDLSQARLFAHIQCQRVTLSPNPVLPLSPLRTLSELLLNQAPEGIQNSWPSTHLNSDNVKYNVKPPQSAHKLDPVEWPTLEDMKGHITGSRGKS